MNIPTDNAFKTRGSLSHYSSCPLSSPASGLCLPYLTVATTYSDRVPILYFPPQMPRPEET